MNAADLHKKFDEALADGARIIRVGRTAHAIVDAADYPLVAQYNWFVRRDPRCRDLVYALRRFTDAGRERGQMMHKLITGFSLTDHIDHDGLNNRRSNLRAATPSQNNMNQRPSGRGGSKYKGVSWDKRNLRWRALIRLNGRNIELGRYRDEHAAGEAYNAAARELFGEFAYLNVITRPPVADLSLLDNYQRKVPR